MKRKPLESLFGLITGIVVICLLMALTVVFALDSRTGKVLPRSASADSISDNGQAAEAQYGQADTPETYGFTEPVITETQDYNTDDEPIYTDVSGFTDDGGYTENGGEGTGDYPTALAVPDETPDPMGIRAQEILESMTIDEKLYQLFIVSPEALTGVTAVTIAGQTTQTALASYPVGGFLYSKMNFVSREQSMTMLSGVQTFSEIPLFLAVDEEGGRVSRVSYAGNKLGYNSIPPMKDIGAIGDVNAAEAAGAEIGLMLSELGLNLDFAPVADIGFESEVIGDRSFSDNPDTVSAMVSAFVIGLHDSGIGATLKHFPGHGSALGDTHSTLAVSDHSAEEFYNSDFKPFAAGISAGAEFVMVSHISAPSIDPDNIASQSYIIITENLRNRLGFTGVIITDAMNMNAVPDLGGYEAVQAITSGADMILLPRDIDAAFAALKKAYDEGVITEARIDESVLRILRTKLTMSIMS